MIEIRVAPVEPEVLPIGTDLLWPLLLKILNDGDPFDSVTEASLREQSVIIEKDSHTATLLRGALMGMPGAWPSYLPGPAEKDRPAYDLRDQLAALLAELDQRGSLQIGATPR